MAKRTIIISEAQFRKIVKNTLKEDVDEKVNWKNVGAAAAIGAATLGASQIDDGSNDTEPDTRSAWQIEQDADDMGLHGLDDETLDFNDAARMTWEKDSDDLNEGQIRKIVRESIKKALKNYNK